ncbi:MinD/ParA family protein [Halanaerobaculum tunisiense]
MDQAEKLRNLVKDQESQEQTSEPGDDSALIYAITSGKGGVGKSNFVANLALALQAEDQRVLVFDADLGLANLDVILGVTPHYNLNHVISGTKSLEEIIVSGPQGLPLIPGGSGVEDLANLSKYQIDNLINYWQEVAGRYDIILIDTGAGLANNVLNFVLAADQVIMVTTPEPTSVTDAYGVIKVINSHDAEANIKLVVNQVENTSEGDRIGNRLVTTAQDFLELDIEFVGDLPADKAVVKAVKQKSPFVVEFPNSQVTRRIKQIARKLLHKEPEKTTGIKDFFSSMFGFK